MMRRFAFILVGMVLFVLAAAVIIPLVVDVDQYRPKIVQKINEQLNGKLEVGKFSLTLWGAARVEIGGISLTDPRGGKLVSVKDAWLEIPLLTLLSGSPEVFFRLKAPELTVTKGATGRFNFQEMVKSAPAEPLTGSAPPPPSQPQAKGEEGKLVLPGILARARLSVECEGARLVYRDEMTGVSSKIEDLGIQARDLSLTRPMEIVVSARLNTQAGKSLQVKGPLRFQSTAQLRMQQDRLTGLELAVKLDLDRLEISSGTVFRKKAGSPLNFESKLALDQTQLKVDSASFRFMNAQIDLTGTVSNYEVAPLVDLTAKSGEIDFEPWVELMPSLKEWSLGGKIRFEALAKGPLNRLTYRAQLGLSGLTAQAPKLKVKPVLDGEIKIATDQIESIRLTAKAPGTPSVNELEMKGRMVSFQAPALELELRSPGLNLDEWIVFENAGAALPVEPNAKAGTQTAVTAEKAQPPKAVADLDRLLDPLREMPIARATTGRVKMSLRSLKVMGIRMEDLQGLLILKNLTLNLDDFGMKVFSGKVRGNAQLQLLPQAPSYRFSTQVFGLDLSDAVASKFALFKNTVVGRADFDMSAEGASFNPDAAKLRLKGKGSMKVKDAAFTTLDVGRMGTEGINKAIEKVGEKIPTLKGKKVGPADRKFRYEVVSSDFSLGEGKFTAPNMVAKAAANQGIDMTGRLSLGLTDFALNARFDISDTYNLLKARDLSVQVQGVNVEHILAEGNGPVHFPVQVGCTMMAPCYSYGEVAESLGKVALGNVSGALTGKAKGELKKKAEGLLKGAPAPVQKKIEELGKKFKLFQ